LNVGFFIDGSNIFYAQRNNRWHIDFEKLYKYCEKYGTIKIANYYTASPHYKNIKQIEKHRRYKAALINIGYTVIDKELKEIQISKNKKRKGNLDIEMALGIITSSNLYDICILITGDGDFIPIINYLRNIGKNVICIARKSTASLDLKNIVHRFIDLNDIRNEIEKK